MNIRKELASNKAELLHYFRDRTREFIADASARYRDKQYKKKARRINKAFKSSTSTLQKAINQKAKAENWTTKEQLEVVLLTTYASYIAMIEARHSVWLYEYMSFSRRIGELWEPFCKLPFEHPIKELQLFVPPLFTAVKENLTTEIADFIDQLEITEADKSQLKQYYQKVWGLVASGEIKLELDLHFIQDGKKYVVDFKSGFRSNEKGNVNRLLLVASVYQAVEEDYQPTLFVRSEENNNYFQVLAESGTWNAYAGQAAYAAIKRHSGYNLKTGSIRIFSGKKT